MGREGGSQRGGGHALGEMGHVMGREDLGRRAKRVEVVDKVWRGVPGGAAAVRGHVRGDAPCKSPHPKNGGPKKGR
jgi:hypothetical protein